MYKAYRGEIYRPPVVGAHAEKVVERVYISCRADPYIQTDLILEKTQRFSRQTE